MFKTLLNQEEKRQRTEPHEGDLYRSVEVFGKQFELRYGYYENKDRWGPPDVIYPDFMQSPVYTGDGFPFVTMMQEACRFYTSNRAFGDDNVCGDCEHYRHGAEWLGACNCIHNAITP